MFNNRSMQVKLVKDNKSESAPTTKVCHHITTEMVTETVQETVKITAIAVVGGLATLKIVTAACQIAVNICPKH